MEEFEEKGRVQRYLQWRKQQKDDSDTVQEQYRLEYNSLVFLTPSYVLCFSLFFYFKLLGFLNVLSVCVIALLLIFIFIIFLKSIGKKNYFLWASQPKTVYTVVYPLIAYFPSWFYSLFESVVLDKPIGVGFYFFSVIIIAMLTLTYGFTWYGNKNFL
ncbi:MAG: hypothetical protein V1726_02850 [Methanobacteriota archaeon]